jgi:hypothetical protein
MDLRRHLTKVYHPSFYGLFCIILLKETVHGHLTMIPYISIHVLRSDSIKIPSTKRIYGSAPTGRKDHSVAEVAYFNYHGEIEVFLPNRGRKDYIRNSSNSLGGLSVFPLPMPLLN